MPVVAAFIAWTPAHAEPARRFALVVGNNQPLPGSAYAPLQYADDDALRFARFMSSAGADVRLLTAPDARTSERYGALAQAARPPRRAVLLEALDELDAALRATSDRPREVYVYFSGHGSVTSSKAYLHLLDGPFSRTDMHTLVLDRLSAERVHLIVDSCHSYFMANPRGERVPADDDDDRGLDRYPHVGAVLSTSAQQEVHEWSGYEGGVFSYQLIGAMQGAADVDLDGKVTYSEAHAYLVAANGGVIDPAARVRPFVWRPATGEPVLLELRERPGLVRVEVPEPLGGHFHIVDRRGWRVLDAHKPIGSRLGLYLPPTADLVLWLSGRAYAWPDEAAGGALTPLPGGDSPSGVVTRGPIADELRGNLFKRPLTQDFVAGLDAAVRFDGPWQALAIAAPREGLHPVSMGLWAGSGAAVVAGVVATVVFVDARGDASPELYTDDNVATVQAAQRRAEVSSAVMVGGFVGGFALGIAGLVFELFDDSAWGL